MEVHEHIETENPQTGTAYVRDTDRHVASEAQRSSLKANKTNQVIWFVVSLINAILLLRIIFLLLGARDIGFASGLYAVTHPFVAPFSGIFPAPSTAGSYFDSAAILAVIIYTLIAWGITALVDVSRKSAASEA